MHTPPLRHRKSIGSRTAITALPGLVLVLAVVAACSDGQRDEPTVSARRPVALDERIVGLGGSVYAANCASCHGVSGEGTADWRTRGSDGALPPPPHNVTGHTWHHADGLLFRIIRDGCAAYAAGTAPCNMPAFGDQLGEEEIRAVIEFMRTWWGPDERAFQEEVTNNDPFP
jgi:mono/diheme cytochrome c family protein